MPISLAGQALPHDHSSMAGTSEEQRLPPLIPPFLLSPAVISQSFQEELKSPAKERDVVAYRGGCAGKGSMDGAWLKLGIDRERASSDLREIESRSILRV
ncbi:hypothetical protein KM043_003847 [Ampulex compressa]|nr:hypothetical protein KM043_003847 [Ampulex compressa]